MKYLQVNPFSLFYQKMILLMYEKVDNYKNEHKCKTEEIYMCNVCNGPKHPQEVIDKPDWQYCDHCFRYFFNQICYKNHRENKTCETVWKCRECGKMILWKNSTPDSHI